MGEKMNFIWMIYVRGGVTDDNIYDVDDNIV